MLQYQVVKRKPLGGITDGNCKGILIAVYIIVAIILIILTLMQTKKMMQDYHLQ